MDSLSAALGPRRCTGESLPPAAGPASPRTWCNWRCGLDVAVVPPALTTACRPGVRFRPLDGHGTPVRYKLGLAYAQRSPLVDSSLAIALTGGATPGRTVTGTAP